MWRWLWPSGVGIENRISLVLKHWIHRLFLVSIPKYQNYNILRDFSLKANFACPWLQKCQYVQSTTINLRSSGRQPFRIDMVFVNLSTLTIAFGILMDECNIVEWSSVILIFFLIKCRLQHHEAVLSIKGLNLCYTVHYYKNYKLYIFKFGQLLMIIFPSPFTTHKDF